MSVQFSKTVSVTAGNLFTPWATVEANGSVDLSVSGVTDSTVTVQRSLDEGATVKDVEQFTADVEKIIVGSNRSTLYRVGVKTGDHGTDTIACEISG